MVIKKINELSNAERFGTCAECGVGTDEAEIYRITAEIESGSRTSISFCGSCLKKLRKELTDIDVK